MSASRVTFTSVSVLIKSSIIQQIVGLLIYILVNITFYLNEYTFRIFSYWIFVTLSCIFVFLTGTWVSAPLPCEHEVSG